MAVKRCPSCGDLYLAAVEVCADCGTTLVEVDERDSSAAPEPGATPAGGGGEQASWPLETWTMEGRRLLDGMLASAGIPRAWQGSTLVTPSGVRERVQEMVDTVGAGDARVGVDSGALAAVDAEADVGDTVGYEVSDWSDAALDRLSALLDERSIPHGWDDDGDLVVAATHEDAVDALFSELSDEGLDDDDGSGALDLLSDLFLAVDRLARNALDGAASRSLHTASRALVDARLPYGFPPGAWSAIVERAAGLSHQLDDDDVDDDQIETDAAALRETLRDYV